MPEGKAIVTQMLVATLAVAVASAADSAGNPKPKIVISIYSYGDAPPPRFAPELDSQDRFHPNATGPLTDVVSTPPLSSSSWPPWKTPKGTSPNPPMLPLEPFSPVPPATTTEPLPGGGGGGAAPPVPRTQLVTLGWDPSPLPSVVGYQLYIGSASGQYDTTQRVGTQNFATIAVDRAVLYVAVSAITADGLESPLSAELVVTLDH